MVENSQFLLTLDLWQCGGGGGGGAPSTTGETVQP